jgi:type IV pilus assembly protein PilM
MIKNIFLPNKIGNYYLFSKRILGIDIAKTHINITKVLAKGSTFLIEQYAQEQLEPGAPTNYTERTVEALKKAVAQFQRYDEVRIALPSSMVIYKQLKLPFTNHDKIRMVVGFEVEPLLPFSLNDAVLDFIITGVDAATGSSQVLIAAVQKEHLTQQLDIYAQAGLNPLVVTVDLFALYDLFSHIDKYRSLSGSTALLDLGLQTTNVAYITSGQLKFIRTIPHGLSSIAKNVADTLNIPSNQAMENIIRFGAKKEDNAQYTENTTKALDDFWQKIRFTLNSFEQQTAAENNLKQVILLGDGATIKSLVEAGQHILKVPTEIFDISLIASHDRINIAPKVSIPATGIVSVSTALPLSLTENFNLRRDEFAASGGISALQEFIASGSLIILLFGMLIGFSIVQTSRLSSELTSSEHEVVETLKQRFKNIDKDEEGWEDVIDEAKKELRKEQETLFKFSQRGRTSFLQALFELATRIDKDSLGFEVERITLTDTELILKARVRDHDALKVLERELKQSPMFSYVPQQEDPDFTMHIALARPVGDV